MTFGCQMNKHDSEIIETQLIENNYQRVEKPEKAEIIILNTCAVREHSSQKAISIMGSFLKIKKRQNNLFPICILAGCVAQAEKSELLKSLPELDIIIGPQDIYNFSQILNEFLQTKNLLIHCSEDFYYPYEKYYLKRKYQSKFQAFISIMNGCNNFCSYCIVPYTRGREHSRKSEDILNEINYLLEKGYKEITLLGQNVNSYGKDLENEISFSDLLNRIDKFNFDFWLRFITSHPKDISIDLINSYSSFKRVVNHLHLPLQSGSDKILKLMNRKYTRENYKEIIYKLREIKPDINITTDLIVGFPDDNEDDLRKTIELVNEIKFDFAFVFKYSDRKGTASVSYKNKVPQNIIEERHNILLNEILKLSYESNKKMLGKIVKVLAEKVSPKDKNYLSGRTSENKVVIFKGAENLVGKFCRVKIREAKSYTLWGDLVE